MIIPLSASCARILTAEFQAGTVRKEYIARCKGIFPEYVLMMMSGKAMAALTQNEGKR